MNKRGQDGRFCISDREEVLIVGCLSDEAVSTPLRGSTSELYTDEDQSKLLI